MRTVATPQASVELIADREAPANGEVWVGLRFRQEPGWHVYWRNPGDSGGPPELSWHLPAGISADAIVWPVPHRYPLGPLMNYGYGGEVTLPVRLRVAPHAAPGFEAKLSARWIVCREVCVPGRGELTLRFPMGADDRRAVRDWAADIARAKSAAPVAPPAAWRLAAASRAGVFVLDVTMDRPAEEAYFFPADVSTVKEAGRQHAEVRGRRLRLELPKSDQLVGAPSRLRGVLVLPSGAGYTVDAPIASQGARQ